MSQGFHVRIVKNDFKRLARVTAKKADEALAALALEGESIVKQSMQDSPATGETYSRGTRTHTASSPGYAPRVDTGTLINSTKADKVRLKVHRIVSETDYAVKLEFGTTKMAARPFYGPMAQELERVIPDFFDKFLEDEVRP